MRHPWNVKMSVYLASLLAYQSKMSERSGLKTPWPHLCPRSRSTRSVALLLSQEQQVPLHVILQPLYRSHSQDVMSSKRMLRLM
jgi:hypothetical protein